MTNDCVDIVRVRIKSRKPLADLMEHEKVAFPLAPKVGVVSAKLIGKADDVRRIVLRSDGVGAFRAREEKVYVKRYLGRNAKVRGLEGLAWIW